MSEDAARGAFDADQDRRRKALIERLGTIADLMCEKPLEGELGDVAYDLLREAAARISSDRLRFLRATPPVSATASTGDVVERAADAMRAWTSGDADIRGRFSVHQAQKPVAYFADSEEAVREVKRRNARAAIAAALSAPLEEPPFTDDHLLRAALYACQLQFESYAKQHDAKGTPEGKVKAGTNRVYAQMAAEALAATPPPPSADGAGVGDVGEVERYRRALNEISMCITDGDDMFPCRASRDDAILQIASETLESAALRPLSDQAGGECASPS